MKCSKHEIQFKNLILKDLVSKVKVSSVDMKKQTSSWQVSASSLVIEDLKKKSNMSGILFYSLSGELFKENTFVGEGHILADYSLLYHFEDALKHLGLKYDTLAPSNGQTEFLLKDEKIIAAPSSELPFEYRYEEEILKKD